MNRPPSLTKREWALLQHKPNQSALHAVASSKWPALIASTICFGGVNAVVIWVTVRFGEGYAILALLAAMFCMNSICDLDVMGLLNNKRFRANMNGNILAYVFVWVVLLLLPAFLRGVEPDTRRWILFCLLAVPTVVGFLNVLVRDRANVRRTREAVEQFRRFQEGMGRES